MPALRPVPGSREVGVSPFAGTRVRGIVPVLGSARIDGFGFYKLEWASEAVAETWSAVSAVRADPVVNGALDAWDTRLLPDGEYQFVDTYCTLKEVEADRFYAEPTARDFEWYLRTV